MTTLKADDRRRIQIPDAKPGQVFAYQNEAGVLTLTPVKAHADDPFPPDHDFGLTDARNRELLALSKASSLEVPR